MKKLDKKNILDILPLTPLQEGLLYHYLQDPEGPLYFEQLHLHIRGDLHVDLLEKAWNAVLLSNEMLRTVFRWDKMENPVQIILKSHQVRFRFKDNSTESAPDSPDSLLKEDRKESLDLHEVPFRITLVKSGPGNYHLIISSHHILYDGWSNAIILKEVFENYVCLCNERPLRKRPKTRFKEYIRLLEKKDSLAGASFWKEYLKDYDASSRLPLKNNLPAKIAGECGESCLLKIKVQDRRAIESLAQKHKLTPAVYFYTAWGILLQTYTDNDDALLGTTVSGRSAAVEGIEQMVGLFINTLPLRVQTLPGHRLEDLLTQVKGALQQRAPFESVSPADINRWCQSSAGEELFDSIVVVENYPLDTKEMSLGAHAAISSYSSFHMTNYPLTVEVGLLEKETTVTFGYLPSVFHRVTVETIARHFYRALRELITHPERDVAQLELLTSNEKHAILKVLNSETLSSESPGSDAPATPPEPSLTELFESQAARTPDNIAVAISLPGSGSQNETIRHTLTYRELNGQAGNLAGVLVKKGLTPGSIAAVMTPPSLEMIIAIFAILKTGCAYMPIDPGYPGERINYMLADSDVKLVLVDEKSEIRISRSETNPNVQNSNDQNQVNGAVEIFVLNLENLSLDDSGSEFVSDFEFGASDLGLKASSPAYIIYTSGTTGKPKGTVVEHGNITALMQTGQVLFQYGEADVWTMYHSFCFDFSVWEMYGALLFGGRLVLVPPLVARDPGAYLELLDKEEVTVLNQTPAVFYRLIEAESQRQGERLRIRCVIFGGEALKPGALAPWKAQYPQTRLINMYGITETTVHVTVKEITRREIEADLSNIGKPVPGLLACILDRHQRLTPRGVPGELVVGGSGVARGYLNRPQLTGERFIANPFPSALPGSRLYRSGDRVRMLDNGEMEYLGRIDFQVKIRGHRIELGEIERTISDLDGVAETVALARQNANNDFYICAYIIPEPGTGSSISQIRERLSAKLPNYMVPAHFMIMEAFPLTATGKIDRRKLPPPEDRRLVVDTQFRPPESDTARLIATLWRDLLNLERVGIDDNFFEVGGSSIDLMRLKGQLQKKMDIDIPIALLFEYPTIDTFCRYLEESRTPQAKDKTPADGSKVERTGERDRDCERCERGQARKERSYQGDYGLDTAVIGMAGRFPGASSIDAFWENLKEGRESVSFFSDDELLDSGVSPHLLSTPGYVKAKGYLAGVEYFDAGFFNYTPSDAQLMDPQLRVLHECAWHALEVAGYDPGCFDGLIGFYAGAGTHIYWTARMLARLQNPAERFLVGAVNAGYAVCTQVAYRLDLKGPALAIQTACSTSLVAIHTACRALKAGECDMALAGGVGIQLPSREGYLYNEGMVFSPDGHCRAFDARARGTVGGEGVGLVVLKPLHKAVEDGDHIFAIVKGTAINNDGNRKVGYAAPSVKGQADVIRAAHKAAGVDGECISYVETHGTGTVLGDPVEIRALTSAFASDKKQFCRIG
ncbi:MAG: amino acid adenylation domain-containing protein, partial [bacterium]|nr:amino acid adenylation domain-containing protein [bacterium]